MSFSILLVSHPGIAPAILDNARRIWPGNVPATEVLEVPFDAQTESLLLSLNEQLDRLDCGDGVLVLCDIAGASPCNLLAAISQPNVCRISGLNLPMLLRAYNYQQKSLAEVSELIIEGGCKSIVQLG
jgi:PTS system mannose-specific IIA component